MQLNTVKQALKAGELRLGMNFGQLRSPEVPRLLAAAGFHWAFIDTEHGVFDLETVQDVCRVAQLSGLCPVVRVVDLNYGLVVRALDSGAQGIIFPRMEDPKLLRNGSELDPSSQAGVRGYGLQPSQTDYSGLSFSEIIEFTNTNTLTDFHQIESRRAV